MPALAIKDKPAAGKGNGKDRGDSHFADKKSAKTAWTGGIENIVAGRCAGYNDGTCKQNNVGPCPVRHNLLHACSKCCGKHSWGDCPQVSIAEKTGIGFNLKGKNGRGSQWDKKRKRD